MTQFTEPVPFRLDVSEHELTDLIERLENTRLPPQGPHAEWDTGMPTSVMMRVLDHWLNEFDWQKQQHIFNAQPQFLMDVDLSAEANKSGNDTLSIPAEGSLRMHFIHKRSDDPDAVPLLLLHGWPGSVFEFHKIIDQLTTACPEHKDKSFHIVAPSLPGYLFSEAPKSIGFDTLEIAVTVNALMQQLGYPEYVVQGGDWGSVVSTTLGAITPATCRAVHINMIHAGPSEDEDFSKLSESELGKLSHWKEYMMKNEVGYQQIQSTKPQTLGIGLTDSPAGLAAWVLEKFHGWSDCDGDLENAFTMDELLTNVCLYWFSGCITSSVRLYYETMGGRGRATSMNVFALPCSVPTACAVFPKEMCQPPKSWVERAYNLRRWTEFAKGGHFAALEQSQALATDIQAFFLGGDVTPDELPKASTSIAPKSRL